MTVRINGYELMQVNTGFLNNLFCVLLVRQLPGLCEHAGSSDVRGAQNTNAANLSPFLKNTQELSLRYYFDGSTPPPKPTSFSYLLNIHHTILKRLEIIIRRHDAFDIKECEYLRKC